MTQEFVTLPREVVEQVLKAMEDAGMQRGSTGAEFNAIESLRAALEQPQAKQEPASVAKAIGMDEFGPMLLWHRTWTDFPVGTKLYTNPQPYDEPQFDATSVKQEQLAIQFCEEIAGPLGSKPSLPDPVRLLEMAEALYKAEIPLQEIILEDIEQYRMQMAAISTAAMGYWKESDEIHIDYDTVSLRDVAKLYVKYNELYEQVAAIKAVLKLD